MPVRYQPVTVRAWFVGGHRRSPWSVALALLNGRLYSRGRNCETSTELSQRVEDCNAYPLRALRVARGYLERSSGHGGGFRHRPREPVGPLHPRRIHDPVAPYRSFP